MDGGFDSLEQEAADILKRFDGLTRPDQDEPWDLIYLADTPPEFLAERSAREHGRAFPNTPANSPVR
ncbi:MAG: hypothetical protein ACYC1C_18730 [Chloroflexota bacterium]